MGLKFICTVRPRGDTLDFKNAYFLELSVFNANSVSPDLSNQMLHFGASDYDVCQDGFNWIQICNFCL